jgi:hypothetical protein
LTFQSWKGYTHVAGNTWKGYWDVQVAKYIGPALHYPTTESGFAEAKNTLYSLRLAEAQADMKLALKDVTRGQDVSHV